MTKHKIKWNEENEQKTALENEKKIELNSYVVYYSISGECGTFVFLHEHNKMLHFTWIAIRQHVHRACATLLCKDPPNKNTFKLNELSQFLRIILVFSSLLFGNEFVALVAAPEFAKFEMVADSD